MPNLSAAVDRDSFLRALGLERAAAPPELQLSRPGRHAFRIDAARGAMGTRVAITALHRSGDRLEAAVGRAFEEMDRLIAIFSRHDPSSALSSLNDAGRLTHPPRELARVLARARRYHGLSRGAFDVSVAPVVDLFRDRLGAAAPAVPTAAELEEARACVGAHHVETGRRVVRLRRPGMRLTLDGIAKGYIVDRMAAVLEGMRVRDYVIDGGGDIRAGGRKPGRLPWTVAVRDPRDPNSFLDIVRPGTGAVATSGSYERFYDPERRFHHLVDAGTGASPTDAASVTVVAPTAMAADALATAVFVLGPSPGLALVDSLAGCACLMLDRSGRRLHSRGWRSAPSEPVSTE